MGPKRVDDLHGRLSDAGVIGTSMRVEKKPPRLPYHTHLRWVGGSDGGRSAGRVKRPSWVLRQRACGRNALRMGGCRFPTQQHAGWHGCRKGGRRTW
eukprot:364299-Chlamydomonas_euryale.AAC.1